MVKRGSSTFSAAAVARSGLALGRTVEKTVALEAEVSRLRHLISVLSRRLHLSALESESLRRELDALRSVAPLSREGDGAEASPLREEVADEVVVHAPVAVPAAPTVVSLGAHVEALTVTTVASAVVAQEPEPDVAEPVLLVVVQVERSPSADGTDAKRRQRCSCWVDDEAGGASWKAGVIEVVSLSPPPVPAGRYGSPVASAAGGVDPIVMLVILVSLLSAVVGIGKGVAGAIKIVLDFFCPVCVTSLPESGLGGGYDLAYGSV